MAVLVATIPVTFAGTLSLTYDANGNLVTGDGLYREYNSYNQLSTVRNGSNATEPILQEFIYHPTEERILLKRTYNSTNSLVERIIYLDENFVRVINTSGTYDFTYVKHEGQLVAQVNPGGSKYYVHGDHLGSSSVVTNQAGAPIENTTYSPFGEVVSGGNLSRFDYEGKEFDSLVGDYDFHFRKYKPGWALFLQPDTLIQNVYDPQSLNRYAFERNNPYKYTDETGHVTGLELVALIAALIFLAASVLFLVGSIFHATMEISKPAIQAKIMRRNNEYVALFNEVKEQYPDALPDFPYEPYICREGTCYRQTSSIDELRQIQSGELKSSQMTPVINAGQMQTVIQPVISQADVQSTVSSNQGTSSGWSGAPNSGGCDVIMSCAPSGVQPSLPPAPSPPKSKHPGCDVYMSCA